MSCSSSGCLLQNVPAREAAKSALCRGSRGPQACRAERTPQAPPPPSCGPRPKPKTVSELLREKRLREARASKAAQGPVVLPRQLLVSSPVVLQPALPLASPTPPATGPAVSESTLSRPRAPTAAGPSLTSGSWASAEDRGTPVLQALAFVPTSTVAVKAPTAPAASRAPALGPTQLPVSCHLSGLGQSQAPATSRKRGLPEAPPFLPAAPSPAPLPVQPLSLTPALGTHRGEACMAASTPLPVSWVLTAQGLLPMPGPAMAGLSRPAETFEPKGLLVTLSPSLTETPEGQGLASVAMELAPPSKTDLVTLSTPLPSQVPAAGVDSDMARAPEGHSSPGEAQAAGEIASKTVLVADHPGAESARPGPLPTPSRASPSSGPGGTPVSHSDPGGTRGPLDSEEQPPPRPGPEEGALDLGLVSQESEVAVRGWLRGQRGVSVPPLRGRLPYQPPALCSLRALAGLLLHKKALEHKAASLVPSGAASAPQASPGLLRGWLGDNPAYLLLKARFLAAFTLPALLATLPPRGVPTTLSAAACAYPDSGHEDLGELALSGGDRQPGCRTSGSPQARPAATSPVQVGGRGQSPRPTSLHPQLVGVGPAQGAGPGLGSPRRRTQCGFLRSRRLAPSRPAARGCWAAPVPLLGARRGRTWAPDVGCQPGLVAPSGGEPDTGSVHVHMCALARPRLSRGLCTCASGCGLRHRPLGRAACAGPAAPLPVSRRGTGCDTCPRALRLRVPRSPQQGRPCPCGAGRESWAASDPSCQVCEVVPGSVWWPSHFPSWGGSGHGAGGPSQGCGWGLRRPPCRFGPARAAGNAAFLPSCVLG